MLSGSDDSGTTWTEMHAFGGAASIPASSPRVKTKNGPEERQIICKVRGSARASPPCGGGRESNGWTRAETDGSRKGSRGSLVSFRRRELADNQTEASLKMVDPAHRRKGENTREKSRRALTTLACKAERAMQTVLTRRPGVTEQETDDLKEGGKTRRPRGNSGGGKREEDSGKKSPK